MRLSVKVEQLMELICPLAIQSVEFERDADYDKSKGDEEEEAEEGGSWGGAGGGEGEGGGVGEGDGFASVDDGEMLSSEDDDDFYDEPVDLRSTSKRFILDE